MEGMGKWIEGATEISMEKIEKDEERNKETKHEGRETIKKKRKKK